MGGVAHECLRAAGPRGGPGLEPPHAHKQPRRRGHLSHAYRQQMPSFREIVGDCANRGTGHTEGQRGRAAPLRVLQLGVAGRRALREGLGGQRRQQHPEGRDQRGLVPLQRGGDGVEEAKDLPAEPSTARISRSELSRSVRRGSELDKVVEVPFRVDG